MCMCVHVHTRVCACVCMCLPVYVHVSRDQGLMLDIFFNCSPSYFSRQSLAAPRAHWLSYPGWPVCPTDLLVSVPPDLRLQEHATVPSGLPLSLFR